MFTKGTRVKLKNFLPIDKLFNDLDLLPGTEGEVELTPENELIDSYYVRFGKHLIRFRLKEDKDILDTLEKI